MFVDKLDMMILVFIWDYLLYGVIGLFIVVILLVVMFLLSFVINFFLVVMVEDFIVCGKMLEDGDYMCYFCYIVFVWGVVCIVLVVYVGEIVDIVIEAINKIGLVFYGFIFVIFLLVVMIWCMYVFGVNIGLAIGVLVNIYFWFYVLEIFWFWWNVIGIVFILIVGYGVSCLLFGWVKEVVIDFKMDWNCLLGWEVVFLVGFLVLIIGISMSLKYVF